ncbi:MAG TPA: SDR family NAD(P)-dependent oxidoreductase [Candidatus Baltobacteraceae bacterium]|nr:SDR family NAD(P)-dependent oxidoreductase [Candidatus Baltobacteraceae bacterium]
MPDRKVVIVTGAGSGIGRALALQAARKGYAVLAVTKHADHLDDLVKEAALDGNTCAPLALDVTDANAPARIVDAAKQRFGRIDVIVNNAGYATSGALLDQTDEQIDAQWDVHFAAPLRIMKAAFPLLLESHGQVFFTGSGLARVPAPYYGSYCAAKAAVRAAVTQLRRELRGTGVSVTYIDPGSVHTNFAKTAGIETLGPSWVPAKPEQVARAILRAFESRPKRVNAVWWHTLFSVLGEWFPGPTDKSFEGAPVPKPQPQPQPAPIAPPPVETPTEVPEPFELPEPSDFERALEPVARRMERVKLPQSFLEDLLRSGQDVHLSDAAMRWAGMPNKNERAALAEALEALATQGFLERTGDESWRVLRAPA